MLTMSARSIVERWRQAIDSYLKSPRGKEMLRTTRRDDRKALRSILEILPFKDDPGMLVYARSELSSIKDSLSTQTAGCSFEELEQKASQNIGWVKLFLPDQLPHDTVEPVLDSEDEIDQTDTLSPEDDSSGTFLAPIPEGQPHGPDTQPVRYDEAKVKTLMKSNEFDELAMIQEVIIPQDSLPFKSGHPAILPPPNNTKKSNPSPITGVKVDPRRGSR